MNLLVAAPTRREAGAVRGEQLICGSGARAAATVSAHLCRGGVDLVAVVGICGGLDPSLGAGDLILARSVLSPGKPERRPEPSLFEAVRRALRLAGTDFVSAPLLTCERPVGSRTAKSDLWNQWGAAGIDMESYGIVDAVEAQAIPWIALRAVLDPAAARLPAPLLSWRDSGDEPAILGRLARRPATWPAVVRLAAEMVRARRALDHSLPVALDAARSWSPPSSDNRRARRA